MRTLPALLLMASLASVPAGAQPPSSSNPAEVSGSADTTAVPASAGSPQVDPTPASDLPVSLDRIREGLARPPRGAVLKSIDLKPDFVVLVEEQDHLRAVLSKLDVASGPRPAGGLYAYEQQQRAFSKTERPLQQPYAAFGGGELITLAIEGLMQRILGSAIGGAVSSAQHTRAEEEARREVATAIVEYCDGQPDGGRSLHLCTQVVTR